MRHEENITANSTVSRHLVGKCIPISETLTCMKCTSLLSELCGTGIEVPFPALVSSGPRRIQDAANLPCPGSSAGTQRPVGTGSRPAGTCSEQAHLWDKPGGANSSRLSRLVSHFFASVLEGVRWGRLRCGSVEGGLSGGRGGGRGRPHQHFTLPAHSKCSLKVRLASCKAAGRCAVCGEGMNIPGSRAADAVTRCLAIQGTQLLICSAR